MKKIKTDMGYDFYAGDGAYNIVPAGSQAPSGGYHDPLYIVRVKLGTWTVDEKEALKHFDGDKQ
jgi:hypothetical protein